MKKNLFTKHSIKKRKACELIRKNMLAAERTEKALFIKGIILIKSGRGRIGHAACAKSGEYGHRWCRNYCIIQFKF